LNFQLSVFTNFKEKTFKDYLQAFSDFFFFGMQNIFSFFLFLLFLKKGNKMKIY